jgi:hypothetical protein
VLAVAAVAMQFLVAEDRAFHPWALLSPFLLLSLPAMALTAALALLFETVRWLRAGFGNVLWFFLWAFGIGLPAMIGIPQLDPFGIWTVFSSILPAAKATIPGYYESFSLTIADTSVRVFPGFHWDGIHWSPGAILLRVGWVGVAFIIVLARAVFFGRFDRCWPRSPAPCSYRRWRLPSESGPAQPDSSRVFMPRCGTSGPSIAYPESIFPARGVAPWPRGMRGSTWQLQECS